jgi:hypothetical protein
MPPDNRGHEFPDALLPADDRPRGVLSKDDRQFLRGKKEYEHVESNANARSRIRERIINAFLDFTLIDVYLEDRDRERVFDAFDADHVWGGDADLYADEATQIGALDDVIAFIYRETIDRHPPFEKILERGVTQGENDPGAVYLGQYVVEFEVEEIEPENLDVDSIVERVEAGQVDTLTEAEMAAFVQLFATSDAFDSDVVREEFWRRMEQLGEFKDKEGRGPINLGLLLEAEFDDDE